MNGCKMVKLDDVTRWKRYVIRRADDVTRWEGCACDQEIEVLMVPSQNGYLGHHGWEMEVLMWEDEEVWRKEC